MKRVKLTVAYDGTNYCGWQVQPNGVTIESELNRHLSELLGEEIRVIGASRTDAGVHARGNVAVFDTTSRIPAEKISYALNTRLPEDIRIQESCGVPSDFHPRFCHTEKTYEYRICNRAADYLVGTHDFTSFCTNKPEVTDRVRTIYSIDVVRDGEMVTIRVRGNGFLYNMVRIIVGTLLRVGSKMMEPEEIPEILAARDRSRAGDTARPQGLTLVQIRYLPDAAS